MNYPEFFNKIETIKLQDDLSNFLGATEDGIIEFSYIDLVKSAGHSCPTVLGAFLMTQCALKALYKDEIPKRGEINVEFPQSQTEGVTGVIANVVTNITGATMNTGFKGIMGLFSRNNLLAFEEDIDCDIRFTRVDKNISVDVKYNPSLFPPSPDMKDLMQKCLSQTATKKEESEFKTLWQDRVKNISENIDEVIIIKEN